MSLVSRTLSKRRRITKACDFCHRRGRKCRVSEESSSQCMTCVEHGMACTWDRVAAKRGAKPQNQDASVNRWALDESRHGSRSWLQALIDVFFDDVYPIICIVHEAKFKEQWSDGAIPSGRASYARFLAICALSAQRIASGASSVRSQVRENIASYVYIEDAIVAVSAGVKELQGLEYMQAVHLLSLTAMEVGHASLYHQLMGLYHALVADQGLADEKRWPLTMPAHEKEERRRLIWHMYRLEVHTALILGHVIRIPESQIAVEYPEDCSFDVDSEPSSPFPWLAGWNFVTDLYRGLEYVLVSFRTSRQSHGCARRASLSVMGVLSDESKERLLNELLLGYERLPRHLKEAAQMSSDIGRNRCVYQLANIICTHQLLRMLSYAFGNVTFRDACQTVLDLVDAISTIPAEFLRSMSLSMVPELSGFGHLLGSFIGKDMAESDYAHLKSVMLCMSELLECLVSSIPAAHEAALRLAKYVQKIEEHLNSERPRSPTPAHLDSLMGHSTAPRSGSIDLGSFEDIPWAEVFTHGFEQR